MGFVIEGILGSLNLSTYPIHKIPDTPQFGTESLTKALHHYLEYSPVKGLKRHIPAALSLFRKGSEDSDLLIQNHLKFASEIAYLGNELLHSRDLKVPVSDKDAELVAAQVALLVGNAFQYAIEFCEQLKQDKKNLLANIGTGVEMAKIALGAAGTASGVAAGVTESAPLGATKIADIIAKWATEPDQKVDIPQMAAQLARLSDAYKDRSRSALLVPGAEEIDADEANRRGEDLEQISSGAWPSRKRAGTVFFENYTAHLQNFKKRYLESSLEKAKP